MSKKTTQKILELLIEGERIGDQVLAIKQELIELDKQRQNLRSAVRAVEQSADKSAMIHVGAIIMKLKKEEALELMKKDLAQIEIEIKTRQSKQKVLVGQHRDLEFLPAPQGQNLKPLSATEIGGLKANLPTMFR